MSDHDPSRPMSQSARVLAALGSGALLASVALVTGIAMHSETPDLLPQAQAAPTTTTTTSASATTATTSSSPTTTPATTTTATTSSKPSSAYPKDKQGYVDSAARCAANQSLMALGRTARSLVAICVNPDGGLEYRGVRLSDKSSLTVPASRGSDQSLIAENDGVTYSVSPTVFLVSEGDNVLYRDAWIEFQQPGFAAESSGGPTTTVSTTTVTVTTSVTATTSKPAG